MDKKAKVPSHYMDIAHGTVLGVVFLVRLAYPDMSVESGVIFAAIVFGSLITFYILAPREEVASEQELSDG